VRARRAQGADLGALARIPLRTAHRSANACAHARSSAIWLYRHVVRDRRGGVPACHPRAATEVWRSASRAAHLHAVDPGIGSGGGCPWTLSSGPRHSYFTRGKPRATARRSRKIFSQPTADLLEGQGNQGAVRPRLHRSRTAWALAEATAGELLMSDGRRQHQCTPVAIWCLQIMRLRRQFVWTRLKVFAMLKLRDSDQTAWRFYRRRAGLSRNAQSRTTTPQGASHANSREDRLAVRGGCQGAGQAIGPAPGQPHSAGLRVGLAMPR